MGEYRSTEIEKYKMNYPGDLGSPEEVKDLYSEDFSMSN